MMEPHDTPQVDMQSLIESIRKYYPDVDATRLEDAYQFAEKAHHNQYRQNGDPYFVHPVAVASELASLQLDVDTIIAGLLHDVLEDTTVTFQELEARFGNDVATLVEGVTKITKLRFGSREARQLESQRKMIIAMAEDLRVVLIKLADRLHNMRTLKHMPPDRQIAIAQETLEIYAPLAHRLGMSAIKWELEDTALRYIDPTAYYALVEKVDMTRVEREEMIQNIIARLHEKLEEVGVKAEITGRPKHFYSIYNKMRTQNKSFEDLYDLVGIRIIVDSKQDCYMALGVVQTTWLYLQERFKDYISQPRPNNYQSLHTTLIGDNGRPFEIQIRTYEMHRVAEYGVAAHWRYKEGKSGSDIGDKLVWVRQILELKNSLADSSEFMESLKRDILADEVFVFSRDREIFNLPRGATALDFAYRVHSGVGNKCIGAKVNGHIVPLDYKLENGDQIEIMTSQSSKGPGRNWDRMAFLSSTQAKIRAWYKREHREENILLGRDILEKEAIEHGSTLNQLIKPEALAIIYERHNLQTLDDIYAAIGFGALPVRKVIGVLLDREPKKIREVTQEELIEEENRKLVERQKERQKQKKKPSSSGVLVRGEPDLDVRFARCCTPVRGDRIVGFVTRNRGISVHKQDCPNLKDEAAFERERLIEVEWDDNDKTETKYTAELSVIAYNRGAVMLNLFDMFKKRLHIELTSCNMSDLKNQVGTIHLTFEVNDTEQLQAVIDQIRQQSDVIDVLRDSGG